MNYNKIAWSNYFNSYIKCTHYESDNNWFFVKCNKNGKKRFFASLYQNSENYNHFDWQEV